MLNYIIIIVMGEGRGGGVHSRSLKAQTGLCGVVAPFLSTPPTAQSEPLDYHSRQSRFIGLEPGLFQRPVASISILSIFALSLL